MERSASCSKSVEPALAFEALHQLCWSRLNANGDAAARIPAVAIVAGHYCIAPELSELSSDGEAEQQSFATGVALRERLRARGIDAALVLWVNDIGVAPTAREELKRSYTLPAQYAALWQHDGLAADGLHVWFESTMRNNASTLVRKLIKQRPELFSVLPGDDSSLVRCVSDERCSSSRALTSVYTVRGPQGERLVVKDGPNPKCNLILATLYRTIQERLGATLTVSIFNELYRNRIRLGLHVARNITGVHTQMLTAFCDGASLVFEEPAPPRSCEAQ